jgi:hypothetical protein
MLTIILTTLAPALWKLGSGALSGLFGYLKNKQNVQLAEDQASLSAQVATNQAKAQWLASFGPMIVSCTVGEICVIYFGSIVIDSMFHFGWGISKLPPPFDQYFWMILSAFIITTPFAVRAK